MIRVAWVGEDFISTGNGLGYFNAARGIYDALTPHVVWDDTAPLALTIDPPMDIRSIPDKKVVAVTMFESHDLPLGTREQLANADMLVVPSKTSRSIFYNANYTKPIALCPLGVDLVPVTARKYSVPFRFLWIGAQNLRKGLTIAVEAFQQMDGASVGAELYLKTTPLNPDKPESVTTAGGITFDTRNVSREEMHALYASAHAFVFPTIGEGFGMTLSEALSSGLPCLATGYGGHLEFATPRNCILLPFEKVRIGARFGNRSGHSEAPDGKYEYAMVPPSELADAMLAVMATYSNVLELGAEGAAYIRREFTWAQCGERLAAILADAYKRFQL